jgi:hypothetical protein
MMGAGDYTAYLQNGNGNQLEVQKFKIGGGGTTYVNFIGAAVSVVDNRKENVAPGCPVVTAREWNGNLLKRFRAPFNIEVTNPHMLVNVETSITGEKCTKWKFFSCQKWETATETQNQWHISNHLSHWNLITDVFRSGSVTIKSVKCKPLPTEDQWEDREDFNS